MLETLLKTEKLPNIEKRKERLVAELNFARQMAEREPEKWSALVTQAAECFAQAEKGGNISEALVKEVEKRLMPMQAAAKEYTVLCVAHAHIDMNWQWSYDETVMTTVDTMQTMLELLKEYSEFHFSQSQASVYRMVEEYAPYMLPDIRRYIKEGRWEVTASTWVEADKNMPAGESFARHALYSKSYLADLLEIDPDTLDIDFEPDTFGHSRNIPELNNRAGVKYYYHCRGNDGGHYLYRWRSPSGGELLVYRDPYFYSSWADVGIASGTLAQAELTGCKTILRMYGVGDHGGGPTRRDIEALLEMKDWPIFPRIRMGTLGEYFAEAEKVREGLPVEEDEINFICDGCYTSQSRIKAGNIRSERELRETEVYSVFGQLLTGLDKRDYRGSWEKVLFQQFHDILTGSCKIDSREYACGQYQDVQAALRSGRKQALAALAAEIDTSGLVVSEASDHSFGAGSGHRQGERGSGTQRIYHIFNSNGEPFAGNVEILIWDYEGEIGRLRFYNTAGKPLRSQLLEEGGYWAHVYHRFLVETEVPAYGWGTLVTAQVPPKRSFAGVGEKRRQHEERFVLENEYLRAIIDNTSGAVISLVDKRTGTEKLDRNRGGAQLAIIDEASAKSITDWQGVMSSWFVGRHKKVELVAEDIELFPGVQGELRSSVKWKGRLRDSRFEVEIGLDADSRDLDYTVHCDWREFGDSGERIPSLAFIVPLAEKTEWYAYDVPFGILKREPMDIDRPANSFVVSEGGVLVESEARYGFRCVEDSICLKLLRSSTDPDPIPEIGIHDMRFCLSLPGSMEPERLLRKAQAKYLPPQVLSGKSHGGSLGVTGSGLIHEGNAVLSSLKAAEYVDNAWMLRFYETRGECSTERLTFPVPVKRAYAVDVTERHEEAELKTEGSCVELPMEPYRVATVVVEF